MIKSTIPVGYTKAINKKFESNIMFSPEFLREGSSLKDALNPSRTIFGVNAVNSKIEKIMEMFKTSTENNSKVLVMSTDEAEAVKLFSNTYLAARVAFVNEIANFGRHNHLKTKDIIEGVSLDPRIGNHYFSPSVGFGGYCLPKDSKQLVQEYDKTGTENVLLKSIVESNELRKEMIKKFILEDNLKEIRIDGIGHKPGVKNYRNSQKLSLAKMLRDSNVHVEIVDKNFCGEIIEGFKIKKDSNIKKCLNDYIF